MCVLLRTNSATFANNRVVSQDPNGAQKRTRLHNLLSRLVSQPVLDQKWRMLHFLNELSDLPPPVEHLEATDQARFPATPTKRNPASAQVLGSPAFRDAFSRPGLSQIPVNDGSPRASPQSAPADRQERHNERRPRGPAQEQAADLHNGEQKNMASGPTESSLLRDLPFTLQGLSSTNLTFASSKALKLPPTLPVPLISLLHTLAEPSLLYRGLNDFVQSTEGGLVGQSFRSALDKELRSYLGLVATLEGQIRRALAQLDPTLPHSGLGKAGVTLKRCVIWTREATNGLRLMNLMVEGSKSMAA